MSTDSALANRAAYDSWAQTYPALPHNPLMRAEQQALLELWPDVAGARALDLACGSGRYAQLLRERSAASVVAADYSPAMLAQAQVEYRVRADMMSLPFADAQFDVVVCGLAVGHAPRLADWMCEAARVLAPGGTLLYSDFHPEAAHAGMTRSFTDAQQRKHVLQHRIHELAEHAAAAAAAGLAIEALQELRVGRELCEVFTGSDDFYRRWQGLALVLVVRACKS
ncbi:MAG TPA: class I SAM-dependent methyltransferase [Roseateles sp.]|nr:class I SAM-dependent methyltransferase [Roseateles sp.]